MAVKKSKISKQAGVKICADLLYGQKSRKEIVLEITEKYKACEKTVDNWIREASAVVAERIKEAESVRRAIDIDAMAALAKELNLSREWVLRQYHMMATFDPRKIYTVDGAMRPVRDWGDAEAFALGGVESIDERSKDTGEALGTLNKVKFWNRREAVDGIARVMGYNAPEKKNPLEDLDIESLEITFK